MTVTHFRIFISSPDDVSDERAIAANVIENLPFASALRNKITTRIVAWDRSDAPPMLANISPQVVIEEELPRPSECDIVVVIFWARMGTPLTMYGRQYQSGTEYEYREAIENIGKNGLPNVLVYLRTEKMSVDLDDPEYDEKKGQYDRVKKFFENEFTDISSGNAKGGYNRYQTPNEFEGILRSHLEKRIQTILENQLKQASIADATVNTPQLWEGSPFPGLRAFTDKDEAIFFGRGVETDNLVQMVRDNNFVAVVGASGSGKSSVVAAGVLPRIRKTSGKGQWTIISTTPDSLGSTDPFASLSDALLQANPDNPTLKDAIETAYAANNLKRVLDSLLENADADTDESERRVLLFIDQFEELFTTIEEKLALKYIELLLHSLEDGRLHIVMTVRGDFYNNCIAITELAEILQGRTFPLAAPKRDALRMMLERPAERAGLRFENNTLVEKILDDTGDSAGALALLAYLLDELYYRRTPDKILTKAAYKELEGVQGAIGRRSEETYDKLTEEQQKAMTSVFRELVSVKQDGTVTRRRAATHTVAQDSAAQAFIKAMVKARLLVVNRGRDNHQPYVEVAHEALLRSWERLAKWISETQDDLRKLQEMRQAAAEWDRNDRQVYRLWKHELLQPVYEMQNRLAVTFTEVEAAFTRPEAERLMDEFMSYFEADLRDALWRQMNIVARLTEIGVSAIPTMLICLAYSAGSSVKSSLIKALKSHKFSDLLEQISASTNTLRQSMHRDNVREFIWRDYLSISQNPAGKTPGFEEMFVQRIERVEQKFQEMLLREAPELVAIHSYDSNMPRLEAIADSEFDPDFLFGGDFNESSAHDLFSLDALEDTGLDNEKKGKLDWDGAARLGIIDDTPPRPRQETVKKEAPPAEKSEPVVEKPRAEASQKPQVANQVQSTASSSSEEVELPDWLTVAADESVELPDWLMESADSPEEMPDWLKETIETAPASNNNASNSKKDAETSKSSRERKREREQQAARLQYEARRKYLAHESTEAKKNEAIASLEKDAEEEQLQLPAYLANLKKNTGNYKDRYNAILKIGFAMNARVLLLLIELSTDTNEWVRKEAVRCLGRSNDVRVLPFVIMRIKDSRREVQTVADIALKSLEAMQDSS